MSVAQWFLLFTFSFFFVVGRRMEVLPISKKIIDISERLMCDDKMDSSGCTKIESYKDGIIVAGSAHGIKVILS